MHKADNENISHCMYQVYMYIVGDESKPAMCIS